MHLLARDLHGLDDAGAAVDLRQTPADIVFLSFSDAELALVSLLHERADADVPSMRCASLSQLKHPYSVDLYIEQVARHARLVVVRLLGGKDYWAYGVEQLTSAARVHGFALAFVPGDAHGDARLDRASTLPDNELRRIWSFFQDGGPDNIRSFLGLAATLVGSPTPWRESIPVATAGRCVEACRAAAPAALRAFIVFYRSAWLAADVAPMIALADALGARGLAVEAMFVASLKEPASEAAIARTLEDFRPDVIVNATSFSARGEDGGALDRADAPVLQVALATASREAWASSSRGANGADLAMNIVLPEVDGRIFTRAISFKAEATQRRASEFSELRHAPERSRIDYVADLAASWARLRRMENKAKGLALVLSDYPARRGRGGYAIGLDAQASAFAIIEALNDAGYDLGEAAAPRELMRALEDGAHMANVSLEDYRVWFGALPEEFRSRVSATWGDPSQDPSCREGAFRFSCFELGKLVIALQPDRGARAERRDTYHDVDLAPRHSYVAFYLWLRHARRIDALMHLGTHGTLEWLPGKSVMLAADCAPEAVLGPTPVVYPFIVNDPGEAAQAKRRIGAVTVGHLTPPLIEAGLYETASEIESLLDEYANAAALDPRRAKLIAGAVIDEAERCGLASECGVTRDSDIAQALARLDAWLCDVKEMRIGDGLHVFGRASAGDDLRAQCAGAEMSALLHALSGRFIPPGPSGAPSRGRADVLPTGRNLYCIDPRHVPTRTAFDIGRRAAKEVMSRHAQDHGEWPRAIMLDLWGSATIRTGGEDFAQALALIGVIPVWDHASARVSGFEIEPIVNRDFPRVDVTLHISGLFRDMFPGLISLFHDAVQAVAALDEEDEFNPLASSARLGASLLRIFGAAQGNYGLGLSEIISRGEWTALDDLAGAYLDAAGHSFDRNGESVPARDLFAQRVGGADALVHVQDMAEADILSGAAFVDFEGGFAAANRALGGAAALTHVDATRPDRIALRSLEQEIARVVRGRAANPRWIEGQMRHGHRGAAEIAEALDNLFAYAATTGLVREEQFDLIFSATLAVKSVREFLMHDNPRAAGAIAQMFEEAIRRELWRPRRNSVVASINAVKEQVSERCS
jgi:cobaltochelatase CobN